MKCKIHNRIIQHNTIGCAHSDVFEYTFAWTIKRKLPSMMFYFQLVGNIVPVPEIRVMGIETMN